MVNFNVPNLCGANPNLNEALSKVDDLKKEIAAKLDANPSDMVSALGAKIDEVKGSLDELAVDLPEIPDINFQGELTSLINDIDKTTAQGLIEFNSKLAELEKDFGETLKEKGLDLQSLVTDSTAKLSAGGDVCDVAPNIEIPANFSGTGVTTEEKTESVDNAETITLSEKPKDIVSVQGRKTTQSFLTNIQFTQNGKIIVPKQAGIYDRLKVTYTVSVISEKPIEAKQADTDEDEEEVSIVTTNVDASNQKTKFKLSSLIKKLDNVSLGSIDKTKVNSDISSALAAIKSPEFKEKMQADLDKAAEERKKLFADPLNYKPVTTKISPSDKPVQVKVTTPENQNTITTETIRKSNPKTGTLEKVEVQKTEKATISENGLTSRKKVMVEEFLETNKFPSNVDDRDKHLKKHPNFINSFKTKGNIELFLKHRPFEILKISGFAYETNDIENPTAQVTYKKGDTNWTVKALLLSTDVPAKIGLIPDKLYDNFGEIAIVEIKYNYLEKFDPNYNISKVTY